MGRLQGNSPFFVPGPPAKQGFAYQPIVRFVLNEVRGDTVLDLGGGEGAYSLEMKKAGYKTIVADINPESLIIAKNSGLKTRLLAPNEPLGKNIADTVVIIEVLEHVQNPSEFLNSAIDAAKKRVLFTLPCTNDFKSLFDLGLTYHHIAVSDHLWHFSYEELKRLLDGFGEKYSINMGDYLCPWAAICLLQKCVSSPFAFKLMMFLYGIIDRLGLITKRFPTRFYGIIEKQ